MYKSQVVYLWLLRQGLLQVVSHSLVLCYMLFTSLKLFLQICNTNLCFNILLKIHVLWGDLCQYHTSALYNDDTNCLKMPKITQILKLSIYWCVSCTVHDDWWGQPTQYFSLGLCNLIFECLHFLCIGCWIPSRGSNWCWLKQIVNHIKFWIIVNGLINNLNTQQRLTTAYLIALFHHLLFSVLQLD